MIKKSKKIRVGIIGVAGKMGKEIANIAINDPSMSLNAGSEENSHELIGEDIGKILGKNPLNVFVDDNIKSFFKNIDVAIEFGLEQATIRYLKEASKCKVAFLSGSTGISSNTFKLMKKLSNNIPILWSPNMSIGANLVKEIAAEAANKLGKDFDIDITDIHHKEKRDIPSGTALSIKEEIENKLKKSKIKKDVNISAIRAGDATGDHSVIFSGNGERITIKHTSSSRKIFAYGAVKISKWLYKQKAGFYNMKNFLDIKG